MEKLKNFFKKLNNSYIIAAICVILVGIILLGLMIGLVTTPFIKNIPYYSKNIEGSGVGTMKYKLVMLDDGRYERTVDYIQLKQVLITYGDYSYCYGIDYMKDGSKHFKEIIFDNNSAQARVELTSPFKIKYYLVEMTNVGGIVLLVVYCILICFAAAIATILIVKRKDGKVVFTNKMLLLKRLKEVEEMLGIKHDA